MALDQALGQGSECGHITSHQSRRTGEPTRPAGCWREWQERTPACCARPEVRLGQVGLLGGASLPLQRPGSHPVGSARGDGGHGILTSSRGHANRMGLAFARFNEGSPGLEGGWSQARSPSQKVLTRWAWCDPSPRAPLSPGPSAPGIVTAGPEEAQGPGGSGLSGPPLPGPRPPTRGWTHSPEQTSPPRPLWGGSCVGGDSQLCGHLPALTIPAVSWGSGHLPPEPRLPCL